MDTIDAGVYVVIYYNLNNNNENVAARILRLTYTHAHNRSPPLNVAVSINDLTQINAGHFNWFSFSFSFSFLI